jgi:hypothetical protein
VIDTGSCWPGNRHDVVVARGKVADLINGSRPILGDGRYRGINTITGPRRRSDGRLIRDGRYRAHRRIRARASSTSSPGSKAGKSLDNAAAAAMPSTTASTSSQDSGTSRSAQLRVNS